MSPTRSRRFVGAAGLVAALLSGCAITFVDRDGDQHILGFAHVEIAAVPETGTAGRSVEVSSIGALVFVSPIESGIALGYGRQKITALKDNVLVLREIANNEQQADERPKVTENKL